MLDSQLQVRNTEHDRIMVILQVVNDLMSFQRRKGGEGSIAIALNLTIVSAEIVNFDPNNYFDTFAPPLKEFLATFRFMAEFSRKVNSANSVCDIIMSNFVANIYKLTNHQRTCEKN